jgi:hypothetical protein
VLLCGNNALKQMTSLIHVLLCICHHHHMDLQPISGPGLPLWSFVTTTFLQGWIVSPAPNPQHGGPDLRVYDSPETGWPSYTPKTSDRLMTAECETICTPNMNMPTHFHCFMASVNKFIFEYSTKLRFIYFFHMKTKRLSKRKLV